MMYIVNNCYHNVIIMAKLAKKRSKGKKYTTIKKEEKLDRSLKKQYGGKKGKDVYFGMLVGGKHKKNFGKKSKEWRNKRRQKSEGKKGRITLKRKTKRGKK